MRGKISIFGDIRAIYVIFLHESFVIFLFSVIFFNDDVIQRSLLPMITVTTCFYLSYGEKSRSKSYREKTI